MLKKGFLAFVSFFLLFTSVSAQVLFEEYEQDLSPVIDIVDIPPAGISYAGEKIPVILRGKNFFQTSDEQKDFSVYGTEFSDFIVKDDNTAYLFVVCPDKTGATKIRIKFGTTVKNASIKVYPQSRCFNTGDIIFSDGTRLSSSELTYGITDEQRAKAVAVIGLTPFGGALGYGIGLSQSSGLAWANKDTAGWEEEFPEVKLKDYSSSWDHTYHLNGSEAPGEYDSSKNWEYICKDEPAGTENPENQYPLFFWALNYGEGQNLPGSYKENWFIPNVRELAEIGKVREIINQSMDLCEVELIKGGYYSSSNTWGEGKTPFVGFYGKESYEIAELIYTYGNAPKPTYRESGLSKAFVIKRFESAGFSRIKSNEQPEITKISIPVCNDSLIGEKVPVRIYGNNLSGKWVVKNFSEENTLLYDYYRVSDHEIHGFVICPPKENPVVSIIAGDKIRKVKVRFTEKKIQFKKGDLLLTNGMIIRNENLGYGIPNEYKNMIFAMVGDVNQTGTECTAFGLFPSQEEYHLMTKDAGLFNKKLTIAEKNSTENFQKNRDGETIWTHMCLMDKEGTENAEEKYPAFFHARKYGVENNLPEKFQNGWYLPSANEFSQFSLCSLKIYEESNNCFEIPNSVTKPKSKKSWYDGFTPRFWSCSQDMYRKEHFSFIIQDGSVMIEPTYYDDGFYYTSDILCSNRVIAARKFSVTDFRELAYRKPVFDSIAKTATGEYMSGSEYEIEITGKHFTGPFMNKNFSFDGMELARWKLVDDEKILLTVVVPQEPGEHLYTVSCGDIKSDGILKVFDKKKCFTPGDILYTDGKKISYSNLKNGIPDDRKSNIYGIVAITYNGGEKALIMSAAGYQSDYVRNYIEENKLTGKFAEGWSVPPSESVKKIEKERIVHESFKALEINSDFLYNLKYDESNFWHTDKYLFAVKELSLFNAK